MQYIKDRSEPKNINCVSNDLRLDTKVLYILHLLNMYQHSMIKLLVTALFCFWYKLTPLPIVFFTVLCGNNIVPNGSVLKGLTALIFFTLFYL